jgi:hypothetical protein
MVGIGLVWYLLVYFGLVWYEPNTKPIGALRRLSGCVGIYYSSLSALSSGSIVY